MTTCQLLIFKKLHINVIFTFNENCSKNWNTNESRIYKYEVVYVFFRSISCSDDELCTFPLATLIMDNRECECNKCHNNVLLQFLRSSVVVVNLKSALAKLNVVFQQLRSLLFTEKQFSRKRPAPKLKLDHLRRKNKNESVTK